MNALQEMTTFNTGWPTMGTGTLRMPLGLVPGGGATGRCCGPTCPPTMPAGGGQDVIQAELQMLTQLMGILTGLLAGFALGTTAGRLPQPFGPSHPGQAPSRPGASSHGGSTSSSNASAATGADLSRSSALGRTVTQDALAHTNSTPGLCLKNVGAVLRRHGIKCGPAPSAYMVADQLAGNRNMKEVKVSASELKNLPAGAVIVWQRSGNLPHGHISISLGDGREWSGPIRKQMNLGTSFRVFLPQ